MKFKILAVSLLASIVLAACGGGESANEGNATKENETPNIKELVNDYSVGNIEDQTASITSQELIVTDSNGKETAYNLPEEEFFVSIAPYVNETHP